MVARHLRLFCDVEVASVAAVAARPPFSVAADRGEERIVKRRLEIVQIGVVAGFEEEFPAETHPVNHVARFGDRVDLRCGVVENVVEPDAHQQVVFIFFQQGVEADRALQQLFFAGDAVKFEDSVETGDHLVSLRP
ncbi:hypothetical protein SDC9_135650 [bioreactor metagenome]|uniref:Uncharacterized protein n=1 Tax=bioreactor metagenome TaxID=1076179 RepID=A0A645DGS9_9ZZZZ